MHCNLHAVLCEVVRNNDSRIDRVALSNVLEIPHQLGRDVQNITGL